ncbi:hypothetical protein D3C76_1836670 [compost metagenome]
MLGDGRAFKCRIEGRFSDVKPKRVHHVFRNRLKIGQVDHLNWIIIKGETEKQNFEVWCFDISVDTARFKIDG